MSVGEYLHTFRDLAAGGSRGPATALPRYRQVVKPRQASQTSVGGSRRSPGPGTPRSVTRPRRELATSAGGWGSGPSEGEGDAAVAGESAVIEEGDPAAAVQDELDEVVDDVVDDIGVVGDLGGVVDEVEGVAVG